MNSPLVSIITPSFNRVDIISETATSVFRQTYPFWEWIIVDDGSTDNSWSVLEKFAQSDRRVKIFKRDREPSGASTCRNIAVETSLGEYLIFLDSDDLLASFCLEQRVRATKEEPAADLIIFPTLLFSTKPDDLRVLWNIDTGENDLARILRSDPICQTSGPIWKKESFIAVGQWTEGLAVWQDIDLHSRALMAGVSFSKRMDLSPDAFIRISEISLSRTAFNHIEKVQSRIYVFKYVLDNISGYDKNSAVIQALKLMAFNLIVDAIHSNHFNEAKKLINYSEGGKVFGASELQGMKKYMLFRKCKGYKIGVLNKILYKKMEQFAPRLNQSLGQVAYTKEVLI